MVAGIVVPEIQDCDLKRAAVLKIPCGVPLCDTNFATCDRSFLSISKCLLHFFWRNRKSFLNGTNAILKFENLALRYNFFRFLFALQLFLINF